jgi:hypothetical protein
MLRKLLIGSFNLPDGADFFVSHFAALLTTVVILVPSLHPISVVILFACCSTLPSIHLVPPCGSHTLAAASI